MVTEKYIFPTCIIQNIFENASVESAGGALLNNAFKMLHRDIIYIHSDLLYTSLDVQLLRECTGWIIEGYKNFFLPRLRIDLSLGLFGDKSHFVSSQTPSLILMMALEYW